MPDSKPIKRNENILPLSREHHYGLLFCWKIKQGIGKKVPCSRMQKYVSYFWDNHLCGHFEEEERLMFCEVNDKLCEDAISQHVEIRALINEINDAKQVDEDMLKSLASKLENHIRFEEREVFPFLELAISPEKMISIGLALSQAHHSPVSDDYPDEFWVKA
jgi:hemerythrin-like domain-containing protein